MKAKSKVFKNISYLLTITILSHSCTIYRSSNISIEEAMESNSKVRVKTNLNQSYTFQKIGKDEAGIYGIASKNSKAAKQLNKDILHENAANNLVKIKLWEGSIQEINAKNKTISLLVPLLTVAAGILIFAITFEPVEWPYDGV